MTNICEYQINCLSKCDGYFLSQEVKNFKKVTFCHCFDMSDNNTDNKTTLSQDIPENAQDLTIFVQNLLEQMVCVKIISIFI